MRLVKVLTIVVLIVSLFANVVLWMKFGGRRPIIQVNGDSITKRDLDNYLEVRNGPEVKAELVADMLIDQQAKKLNLVPSQDEVEEDYANQRDTNWQYAREIQAKPWIPDEMKKNIKIGIEKARLITYGIDVTDEQRKEEYDRHPSAYDTPAKARVEFALVMDPSHINDVVQVMQKQINPTVIMQDLKGSVAFLGFENKLTIVQPYGDTKTNSAVFNMKPNDVKQLPVGEFARYGAKALVVRLIDKTVGKKANLSDPKVKEKLTLSVAAQRAKPWQEYLSKLWADTRFECEDPNDKRNIEFIFFPDRARSASK